MAADNFGASFAAVALVTYMSSLTSVGYTATQYALLSSAYTYVGQVHERLFRRHGGVARRGSHASRRLCAVLHRCGPPRAFRRSSSASPFRGPSPSTSDILPSRDYRLPCPDVGSAWSATASCLAASGGEGVVKMVKRLSPGARNRPPPIENRLLAALPPADYKRIAALLEVVSPKLKTVLHKPGEPIRHVYFPGTGFCSILTVLQDGNMVEVATIGNEGMIGSLSGARRQRALLDVHGAGRGRLLPHDRGRVSRGNEPSRRVLGPADAFRPGLRRRRHASRPRATRSTRSSSGWRAGC